MKKMSKVDKLLYIINIIVSVLLLFSYLLPYLSPTSFPSLAVVSLGVPILIIINMVFAIYWLIRLKKQFFVSFFILILGFNYVTSLYKLSGKDLTEDNHLKVMSYNVRLFNHYNWNKDKNTASNIFNFINEEDPDVLALQEFYNHPESSISYPFSYIKTKSKTNKFGMAFFSKYEIINSGSLDFKNSANNTIFIDIKKNKDTFRIYNVHLESLNLSTTKENFGEQDSEKLYQRIKTTFSIQAAQTNLLLAHKNEWEGRTIICGDFNNTAYSWVYDQISEGMLDTFLEAGAGFGKTYNYPFPLRIDFILGDENFEIAHFKTYRVKYSDHFPIMAQLH